MIFYGDSDEFQSTLPAWGATPCQLASPYVAFISIHAPRRGSDLLSGHKTTIGGNFNPRSPQGERLTLGSSTNS